MFAHGEKCYCLEMKQIVQLIRQKLKVGVLNTKIVHSIINLMSADIQISDCWFEKPLYSKGTELCFYMHACSLFYRYIDMIMS